jgi:hypothetical protein
VIAKISSGGSFGGALDYLMNPKHKERERAQEREQERQQGRQTEAGRTPPAETKTHEETKPKDDLKRDAPKADERQPKQPQIEERELRPERGRDLADEYEAGQRHRIIGGNMSGQTPRELSREFGLVRELRPDIEKPVHHVSISTGENDRLSVEQWQEIAGTYIEQMGFTNSPHIVIQHRRTKRDHIHILTSRIDFDGKVISEWQSKQRAEKVMREVERKYDLERLPMSRDVMRAAPTRGEQEVFDRTGKLSAKMSLQGHVERALRDEPTATEFIEKLERVGVEVIPNLQSTGRVSGISFRQGDELMKGSNLGRGYSWQGLQQRGLSYDPERDRPALQAATQQAELSRDRVSTVASPARSLAGIANETEPSIGKSAGQYLLDQMNPVRQLENLNPLEQIQGQRQTVQTLGSGIVQGYNLTQDLFARPDATERLQQAAGLDTTGRDAVERLHQAAGIEPVKGEHEAIERLNQAAGVERDHTPTDLTRAPDKALEPGPGSTLTLERAATQEIEAHVIEQTIELIL